MMGCSSGFGACDCEFRFKLDDSVSVVVHQFGVFECFVVELVQLWVSGSFSFRLSPVFVKVGFGSFDVSKYVRSFEADVPVSLCVVCGCWITEDNCCDSPNVCSDCMGVLER
jgi:hypothetical protein